MKVGQTTCVGDIYHLYSCEEADVKVRIPFVCMCVFGQSFMIISYLKAYLRPSDC